MTEITVAEGDGNAEKTGYWTVTGPQPTKDLYAIIERTLRIPEKGDAYTAYMWWLEQRMPAERNQARGRLEVVRQGQGDTVDEAVDQIRAVWPDEGELLDPIFPDLTN